MSPGTRIHRALGILIAIVAIGCGSEQDSPSNHDGGYADATQVGNGGDGSGSSGSSGMPSDATTSGDGAQGTEDDGSLAYFGGEGGPQCLVWGTACSLGTQCCSGVCDPVANTCTSSVGACSPTSTPCTAGTDCCSGSCIAGQCGAAQCLTIGAACPVSGNACCTANCQNNTCQPIVSNPSCTTAGNSCTSSAQCCSGLCDPVLNTCDLASSYCIQTNDICYHANDCCGGICNAPNGQAVTAANPGVCSHPSSGGVNCTGVDGSLCRGGDGGTCGGCCSRLCAPYGPTGVNICQPARGCRVEGDLCRTSADCCGGPGSGVLGDGEVTCSNSVNGGDVGVCMTPLPDAGGVCVPEGDVCHYTASNYTCGVSSARSDCCGSQRPKFDACVLDPFGVPRCNAYGGDAGNCVDRGGACAQATDCCNGNPCVLNSLGELACSSTACQAAGQSCTTNADCCPGLPCITLPGSLAGTCAPINPPPPPPSDGGTVSPDGGGSPSDAGNPPDDSGINGDGGFQCALYGQSCTSLPCCAGTSCIGQICSTF